ncbi:MAG: VCBS repeat-containing protein [Clostridium sp.]|nr:VCBS repeat-containing protein [Clostridium sp.]
MKLKILIFKKHYIYFTCLIILVLVLGALFFISKNTCYIFSTINDKSTINNYDLTGDGLKDSIYISTLEGKYKVNIMVNSKKYPLESKNKLNLLGIHYNYWPIRFTLMDVSRDKLPEIFVQASQNNAAIQNVFIWNNNKFENVMNSSNNILGFIDYHNNRTPKTLIGNIDNDDIYISNYIMKNNTFSKYVSNYNKNFLGKDSIFKFVQYVKSLPYNVMSKPENIFYPSDLNSVYNSIDYLCQSNSTFSFQDATFMDNHCSKDGNISEMKWTLNFKGISNTDKSIIKNYTMDLILKPYGDSKEANYFKIYSIKITNNNFTN